MQKKMILTVLVATLAAAPAINVDAYTIPTTGLPIVAGGPQETMIALGGAKKPKSKKGGLSKKSKPTKLGSKKSKKAKKKRKGGLRK